MTEALDVPYRERERSVTMEPMGEHDELLTINIGPHHPATHGVLRLLTTLEGEIVRDVQADHRLRPHRDREELRGPAVLEGHPVRRADGLPLVLLQRAGVLHGGGAAARRGGAAASAVAARDPPRAEPDRLAPVLDRHRVHSTSGRSRCSGGAAATATSRSTCSRCRAASASTRATSRWAAWSRTSRPGSRRRTRRFIEDDAHAHPAVPQPARPQRDLAPAHKGHGHRAARGRCSSSA